MPLIRPLLLILTLLATLPARAQGQGLFDDDIRFGAGTLSCAAAYGVMEVMLRDADVFDPRPELDARAGYSHELYGQRTRELMQALAQEVGSADAAMEQVRPLYQQYARYVLHAYTTFGAFDLFSLPHMLDRCDKAFGFTTRSDWYFRIDDTGKDPALTWFSPALFADRAACAATYAAADQLWNDSYTVPAVKAFFAFHPDNRLSLLRLQDRARVAAQGADPERIAELTDRITGIPYLRQDLLGADAWELAALADAMTRCDRMLDLHPRSRVMLAGKDFDTLGDSRCIAWLMIAEDQTRAQASGENPVIAARLRDYFREAGATELMDQHDLLEDQAMDLAETFRGAIENGSYTAEQVEDAIAGCLQ